MVSPLIVVSCHAPVLGLKHHLMALIITLFDLKPEYSELTYIIVQAGFS